MTLSASIFRLMGQQDARNSHVEGDELPTVEELVESLLSSGVLDGETYQPEHLQAYAAEWLAAATR